MQTVELNARDLDWTTRSLVDAFAGHAPLPNLFTGARAEEKAAYFMRCSAKYALLYGECQAPEDRSGVALWLVPSATRMTPGRMLRAGMFAAPFRLGWHDFKRFGAFASHTDKVHRACLSDAHYYLLAVGVNPDRRGAGIGRGLVETMLQRARGEGRPVYLETQTRENVRLYERLGFAVASETTIPGLGLPNYGMVWR